VAEETLLKEALRFEVSRRGYTPVSDELLDLVLAWVNSAISTSAGAKALKFKSGTQFPHKAAVVLRNAVRDGTIVISKGKP
jgi:hypothetical protein